MYSIVAFLEARIDALTTNKAKLEKRINKLETYVVELCEEDCTDEYKMLVRNDVLSDDEII
jgi:cell division protein FtsB